MRLGRIRIFLSCTLAALALSVGLSSSAAASPAWKFEGSQLSGSETIVGGAAEGSLSIPSLLTTCDFPYAMTISNLAGTATGLVTELPIVNCSTESKACTVETIGPESLPWPVRGTTVTSKNYVVVEGIKIALVYEGAACALAETLITIKGTAGGLFDNKTHTFAFSPASFTATGTKLTAFGSAVQWNGTFTTEATGAHSGQPLEL